MHRIMRQLPLLLEKVVKICKVDQNGAVHFESGRLNNSEKIKSALAARFLANKLEPKIRREMTVKEISESLGIPKNIISATLKEIKDQRVAFTSSKGDYSIYPYQIATLLDKLSQKYGK